MSIFDPIDLGEYTQESYAKYLLGGNQRGYQGLLDNLRSDEDVSKEQEFIRSKGPYLQGVPAAQWSNTPWPEFARNTDTTFAPNGLDPAIISAFEQVGFEQLQKHQEEAVEWLTDDKHALVAASTGRGKTEAWFLPILQYALRAKQRKLDNVSQNRESIKAVITYPTKALAQDQLKRFIEYLWLVNEESNLPPGQKLTIGVYDGDTPHRSYSPEKGIDTHNYLIKSFQYFELPKKIAQMTAVNGEKTLESVPPNVYVKKDKSEFKLQMREEYGGHTLDFVHLTRDKIEESPPDILLTNPDTINYRLFNINDDESHRLFIDQPKFLVFDEVHTYEGLFGAQVSTLVKRLRRLRNERNINKELRIIASSATIDEREELFQRLFTIPSSERGHSYELIEEKTEDETSASGNSMPKFLYEDSLDEEKVEAAIEHAIKGETYETQPWIKTVVDNPMTYDSVSDFIKGAAEDGPLQCIDHLHHILQDPSKDEYDIADAPKFGDFASYINSTYGIESSQAEQAAENVILLFGLGGYETRIHVFNWPVDGYYKCIHCHRIYSSPQSCNCDGHDSSVSFVTKIRLCTHCGEQVYEGWYCPDCQDVRPVTQETEGEYIYATKPECNHPQHDELVRVYWTPEYECESCDYHTRPSDSLEPCDCGGTLTRTVDGVVCKNPECQRTQTESSFACENCGSNLEPEGEVAHQCTDPECEGHAIDQNGIHCNQCDAPIVPKLTLPWVCTNEDHANRYDPENRPEKCSCNRGTFVLPAFIDTQQADYCQDCNEELKGEVYHLAGTGCRKDGHSNIDRINKSFSLKSAYLDSNGNVRLESRGKSSHAVPCYHGRQQNYDSLMRAPSSTGVTMGQFMLRKLSDDSGDQRLGKMMSFADSYRDMERLGNDFDEPEKLLFVQQCLLEYLDEQGTVTLDELIQESLNKARDYWSNLETSDRFEEKLSYSEWRGTIVGELIEGTYLRFRGQVENAYAELVNSGFVDIKFESSPRSRGVSAVCQRLLEGNKQLKNEFLKIIREQEGISNPVEALDNAVEAGLVAVDNDYDRVSINPEALEVSLVTSDNLIDYSPVYDQFISSATQQVEEDPWENTVPFSIPYTERTTLESPYFNRTAYWAATTDPRLLLSEVYKGDLKAEERRQIEHEFKHNASPNLLSTGPAMEIGIDIGDLNALLLMGTPPNTNAYLQRIGRAGRDAGKSLVTTVSKRNPIDFFYHKQPDELISSGEKPIPLDQHNEHVLEVSLTWAVMDYIAAWYEIPWEYENSIDFEGFTKPDPSQWDQYRKDHPTDAIDEDYENFTRLYNTHVEQVQYGQVLEVLSNIVENDGGVREWLEEILEYNFCRNCDRIFKVSVTDQCPNCETGELRLAKKEFSEIIDDVIENFAERIVMSVWQYGQSLEQEQENLEQQYQDIKETIGTTTKFSGGFGDDSGENNNPEHEEKRRRLDRVNEQLDILGELREEFEDSSFSEIHARSEQSKYKPNLRAMGEDVSVTRIERDEHGNASPTTEDSWSRDAAMALREMHPYAHVLRNKRGFIVTRIEEDTEGTRKLQEVLGEARFRCESCGFDTDWNEQQSCPECGAGQQQIRKTEPIALSEVEMTQDSLTVEDTDVTEVYPLTDYTTSPRSTFAHVNTTIPEFTAEKTIDICGPEGNSVFTIEYGGIDIVETTSSFTTSYDDGQRDPSDQSIRLCRHGECNSIVIKDTSGQDLCLRDPSHNPTKQSDVTVGRTFSTKGVRITSPTESDAAIHTLAHGLRLALQRTGGVDIRSLQESFDADATDDEAFIIESAVGGNGVTNLLFKREDETYPELVEALKVMYQNIDGCDCSSGCPECIFQYGCSENNKDRTFEKETLTHLLKSILSVSHADITTKR